VRQNRVTPFVFFITIYAALIRRYTGKQPVALWGHFANRQNAQTQNGVGWLANTHLIVSANWENESSQVQMSRTRHAVLAASAHQEIPVALVWRAMGGYPNDPDAKLLLDVSSSEKTLYQSGNLRIGHASHLLPAYGRFSNLGVYVRDDKETFNVTAQFNVDRFHKGGIRQLLKDFREEIGRFLSSSD
jgi:surfactin family lipopeptide synthetase A